MTFPQPHESGKISMKQQESCVLGYERRFNEFPMREQHRIQLQGSLYAYVVDLQDIYPQAQRRSSPSFRDHLPHRECNLFKCKCNNGALSRPSTSINQPYKRISGFLLKFHFDFNCEINDFSFINDRRKSYRPTPRSERPLTDLHSK